MKIEMKQGEGGEEGEKGQLATWIEKHPTFMMVTSALLYAVSSFLITVINKVTLTSFK